MFGWLKKLFTKSSKDKSKAPPLVADLSSRNYDDLAADFFWMERGDQIEVLDRLGVDFPVMVLDGATPHDHVDALIWARDVLEPAYYWRSYLQLLVQMMEQGRYYGVVHILQNIFPTLDEAKLYANRIKEGKIDW